MTRKTMITGAILTAVLMLPAVAAAGDVSWGFRVGIGGAGGRVDVGYSRGRGTRGHVDVAYSRGHAPRGHVDVGSSHRSGQAVRHGPKAGRRHVRRVSRHRHVEQPVYGEVWVAPVYRSVFRGRDFCGRPVYRRVLVVAGYYRRVVLHHVCGSCGVRMH